MATAVDEILKSGDKRSEVHSAILTTNIKGGNPPESDEFPFPPIPLNAPELWNSYRPKIESKPGAYKLFYGAKQYWPYHIGIVSLGSDVEKPNASSALKNEAIRVAMAIGAKKLRDAGARAIHVDVSTVNPQAVAEGIALGLFKFSLKTTKNESDPDEDKPPYFMYHWLLDAQSWDTGIIHATAQNLARELTELPANMMTPTIFCDRISNEFKNLPNVEVFVRDEVWAAEKGMRTFLSVTKGTDEPAKFLEVHYKGAADKSTFHLGLVGKGITFDSGGISIKPAANMKLMRGDMGGAAAVMASMVAIAKLRLPINIVAVTPLCENLPGPSANKPGDIIVAMNGKTIEIDNTDAEGRLVLSDALYYVSSVYKPKTLIDAATLTGAMAIALGDVYSGVFTNSDTLWESLHAAGVTTHDQFWRMPLEEAYAHQIKGSNADLCNTGGRPAGSCTAALFLKSFVEGVDGDEPTTQWAHVDIAGTMEASIPGAYQEKGMTGRPVRAFIEFARQYAKSL